MERNESKNAKFGKEPEPVADTIRRSSPAQPGTPAKAETAIIAEHTVQSGETLSHLALKYYGSAVKEKWMVIYEANKEIIGDNPSRVRLGLVLKIPKLPEA
jgi:nucleoid-associated protein YgaU